MTYSRALEAGVRTARLPIEEHMVRQPNGKNFHSKILAINQGERLLLPLEMPLWGRYDLSKETKKSKKLPS